MRDNKQSEIINLGTHQEKKGLKIDTLPSTLFSSQTPHLHCPLASLHFCFPRHNSSTISFSLVLFFSDQHHRPPPLPHSLSSLPFAFTDQLTLSSAQPPQPFPACLQPQQTHSHPPAEQSSPIDLFSSSSLTGHHSSHTLQLSQPPSVLLLWLAHRIGPSVVQLAIDNLDR
ncbi:hypothetical protein OIU74_003808 [Salix koriyanagi]|uniref:Uncharacterized protein n=1 Tax=Salix koriyanagi TaxID=2511006 RepID=A0A9Q0ZLD7_9ROSI|nr:hypothetical protein OIU74_003808 [Salix koriyanagi]